MSDDQKFVAREFFALGNKMYAPGDVVSVDAVRRMAAKMVNVLVEAYVEPVEVASVADSLGLVDTDDIDADEEDFPPPASVPEVDDVGPPIAQLAVDMLLDMSVDEIMAAVEGDPALAAAVRAGEMERPADVQRSTLLAKLSV